jgi:Zn-dependent peptidase ImmA (M78 family)
VSARFYVRNAREDLIPLRKRLAELGGVFDADQAADVAQLASVVCDCEVLLINQLSEARVVASLRDNYGVDVSEIATADNAPLAGALCVANSGAFRWIMVRAEDSRERQRFTIAHELGHLFLEVEPELQRKAAEVASADLVERAGPELRVFSRCSVTESPEADGSPGKVSRSRLSSAALREIKAHHFAAELLMPHEGVQRLISQFGGATGIRTVADRDKLVSAIAARYVVSAAAARRRVEKDFEIVPISNDPNRDLFG